MEMFSQASNFGFFFHDLIKKQKRQTLIFSMQQDKTFQILFHNDHYSLTIKSDISDEQKR